MIGLDGDVFVVCGRARRHNHLLVASPLLFRKQSDEGRVEVVGAGLPQQVRRRAGGQHSPIIHRHQPGEPRRLLHVGGCDDDAHLGTAFSDVLDQLPELSPRKRIHACGRFIEDQQIGIVNQRAAETELLLHAARELARRSIDKGRKARIPEKRRDPLLALTPIMAEQTAEKVDVLEDGQRWVEILAEALRHIGNPRTGPPAVRGIGHVAAEHMNLPGLNLASSGNKRKQARFADPVRSNQSDYACGRNVERDAVKRARRTVGQTDRAQMDHRF